MSRRHPRVLLAAGASVALGVAGLLLPSPTVTAVSPDLASDTINLSGSSGKVALVRATSALACGVSCANDPAVVDFVGYGSANDAEGSPAPRTTNSTSVSRGDRGDTDDNAADFTVGAPTPTPAGGGTEPGPGPEPTAVPIPRIQGPGHVSPYAGQRVTTRGVVTARKADGYWIQDPAGDGDETTSDGLYVFTGTSGAKPEVGQTVSVTGRVSEFRPGSRTGPNLGLTEIEGSTFSVEDGSAPLPPPVLVGPGGRVAPAQNADSASTRIDVETSGEFRPDRDAVDFYETLEGMLVALDDPDVVGPTNQYGEMVVVPAGSADLPRTRSSGVRYGSYATPNTARLTVDDEITGRMPAANVGDRLAGRVRGPLSYDFGMVRIFPTTVPTVMSGGLERETTTPPGRDELAVATFNVENLDPTDDQAKFDELAGLVVDNLAAPDIVAVEEVQDNTGAECPDGPSPTCTPDGVVAADVTLDRLVAAIRAAGGPAYNWRQISPTNLSDGGEPTGNIRVAFLFRTDRGLRFVDRPGGDATTPTAVRRLPDGHPALTLSPGRVDPTNPAWTDSRKPLAGEFRFRGRPVFVIATHFSSKGGDEPIMSRWQPPARPSETQRLAQARVVHDFVADILAVDEDASVVVAGDVNDFEFSPTTETLTAGGVLTSLPTVLPAPERYSYVFDGNSQVLDQLLVSPGLLRAGRPGPRSKVRAYDIVHVNAEFAVQTSDHDPQVVRLAP